MGIFKDYHLLIFSAEFELQKIAACLFDIATNCCVGTMASSEYHIVQGCVLLLIF